MRGIRPGDVADERNRTRSCWVSSVPGTLQPSPPSCLQTASGPWLQFPKSKGSWPDPQTLSLKSNQEVWPQPPPTLEATQGPLDPLCPAPQGSPRSALSLSASSLSQTQTPGGEPDGAAASSFTAHCAQSSVLAEPPTNSSATPGELEIPSF